MNEFSKKIIQFFLLIFSVNCFAYNQLPDPQTTRLKSMGGTGVGSILLNESPILNPASVIFFKKSSFYYQGDTLKLDERSTQRTTEYKTGKDTIVTIIDTSSPIKGGLSYQYQNQSLGKRVRYSASLARHLGKSASLGVIYNYTDEDSIALDKTYKQFVLGGTYIPTPELSLGFTIVDPQQDNSEFFRYTLGSHYSVNDFIGLLVDVGSGDVENYESEGFINFAIQLQSFKRLFLRYGRFHDKMQNAKGTGVGFSWVGPRFSFDYALKITESISKNSGTIYADEQIKESSFAVALVF